MYIAAESKQQTMGKFKHDLGVAAEDKVTGFSGIIVGRAQYLTGCNQYCVKPRVDEKGDVRKGQWFDEGELNITGEGITAKEVASPAPGGPQRDAPEA